MLKNDHPSAFDLEAWTVDEQSEDVETHILSCDQCRNYVDTLEIDRQEFLENEDAAAFLARPSVAKVIKEQINANKRQRRLQYQAELSDALPYQATPEIEGPKSANDNIVTFNPKRWALGSLMAAAAAVVFFFINSVDKPSAPPDEYLLKGASKIHVIVQRQEKKIRMSAEVFLQAGDQFQVQATLKKESTVTIGILESDGSWTPLLTNKTLSAGEHLVSSRAFQVSQSVINGWIIMGPPSVVAQAIVDNNLDHVVKCKLTSSTQP